MEMKSEYISLIFSLFLCLDNLNNYENKIKSDSNGNEISLISGILGNILISWSKLFFKYFFKITKLKTFLNKFIKVIFYFHFIKKHKI